MTHDFTTCREATHGSGTSGLMKDAGWLGVCYGMLPDLHPH